MDKSLLTRILSVFLLLFATTSNATEVDWNGWNGGISIRESRVESHSDYNHTQNVNGRDPVACNNTDSFGFDYSPSCPVKADYSSNYNYSKNLTNLTFKLGYNWQLNDYVWGVLGTLYTPNTSKVDDTAVIGTFANKLTVSIKQRDIFDARLIFGKAIDRFLPYVTVGISGAKLNSNVNQDWEYYNISDTQQDFSNSKLKVGFVVGAGLNYAVDEKWFISAEYLHADYGSLNLSHNESNTVVGGTLFSFPNTNLRTDVTSNSLQFGLNYKF